MDTLKQLQATAIFYIKTNLNGQNWTHKTKQIKMSENQIERASILFELYPILKKRTI
jgi:hypothetical protein